MYITRAEGSIGNTFSRTVTIVLLFYYAIYLSLAQLLDERAVVSAILTEFGYYESKVYGVYEHYFTYRIKCCLCIFMRLIPLIYIYIYIYIL